MFRMFPSVLLAICLSGCGEVEVASKLEQRYEISIEMASDEACSREQRFAMDHGELASQVLTGSICSGELCHLSRTFQKLHDVYYYAALDADDQCILRETKEFASEEYYRAKFEIDNDTIKQLGLSSDTLQALKRADYRFDTGKNKSFSWASGATQLDDKYEFYATYSSSAVEQDTLYIKDKPLKVLFLKE